MEKRSGNKLTTGLVYKVLGRFIWSVSARKVRRKDFFLSTHFLLIDS
jgi:hypothetical protein